MDGLIAILFLFIAMLTVSLAALYYERGDRFGMILSSFTALVCLIQFGSRIQS